MYLTQRVDEKERPRKGLHTRARPIRLRFGTQTNTLLHSLTSGPVWPLQSSRVQSNPLSDNSKPIKLRAGTDAAPIMQILVHKHTNTLQWTRMEFALTFAFVLFRPLLVEVPNDLTDRKERKSERSQ